MGNGGFKSRPGRPASSGKASGSIHATGHSAGIGGGQPVGHSGGYSGGSMNKPGSSSPSGNSSSSSSSSSSGNSGKRAGLGGSLLSSLLPSLIGGLASSSSNSGSSSSSGGSLLSSLVGNKSKKSCLSRIITILIIIVVAYFLLKSCGACSTIDVNSLFSGGSFMDSLSASGDSASYSGLEDLDTISEDEGEDENNDFTPETFESTGNRTKRTNILGNGKDVYTVMVYMCGTDLESKYGMATADIKEMIAAKPGSKVNIIIQTGGAKKWQNSTVSANNIQRFKVTSKGIQKLQTLDDASMTKPATLSSFIKYCAKNYKANRYALIFWDHGGGSITGFGYDETESGNDSMTLDEIYTALDDGGVDFDFVGFDACLMGSVETAYVLNYHSDYMIASEETEPGTGWYYTDWLSELSANTSMPTTTIGKNIIDGFVSHCQRNEKSTLSLIDLVDFSNITDGAIKKFSSSSAKLLDASDYNSIASARGSAKEFGDNSYDQVDLMDVANRMNSSEAKNLVAALKKCIKYNKTSSNITNANGLSIYFPYKQLRSMSSMLKLYDKVGVCSEYRSMTKKFANLVLGGKIAASGSSGGTSVGGMEFSDLLGSFLGGSSSSSGFDLGSLSSLITGRSIDVPVLSTGDVDWIDTEYIQSHANDYTADKMLDPSRIRLTSKNGGKFLSLTQAEWDLVADVQEQLFIYDDVNHFYIDFGMDAPDYKFLTEEELDLYAGFDGSWICIDGQPCCVYLDSYDEYGDEWQFTYRTPALLETTLDQLDGKLADTAVNVVGTEKAAIPVYVYIIRNNTTGDKYSIAYAKPIYQNGETDAQHKTIQLKKGDVLYPLCDCYGEDYNFIDTQYLGENGEGVHYTISNNNDVCRLELGGDEEGEEGYYWYSRYCVTDIYGNEYWTELVTNAE